MIAAFIALAFALSVVLLATQASSIWSTGAGIEVQPAVQVAPSGALNVHEVHLPVGCHRTKFGCAKGGAAAKP
jgi:hypothetical protein